MDGDEAGAWSVIENAMGAGMAIEEVYLDLLTPALRSVGDRWESGEITVADEHVASAVTLRLIGRLGPQFSRRGRKRGTVVVAAPAGETHSLPIALFADLLRGRGFRVLDLGGDVPADSLASIVAEDGQPVGGLPRLHHHGQRRGDRRGDRRRARRHVRRDPGAADRPSPARRWPGPSGPTMAGCPRTLRSI